MNRFTLPLLFLLGALAFAPALGAFDDMADWNDKTLPDAVKTQLLQTAIWHRVPVGMEGFTPAPHPPLVLRAACAVKVDSAFYRELEERGAIVTRGKGCAKMILWASEGDTGITYTYRELQKKFLPLDSETEAASFLFATGVGSNAGWYGTTLNGKIYIMTDDALCNGYAHIRKIFSFTPDASAVLAGTVTEPAPKGSSCGVRSN